MKYLIIGGVAGGATAAARVRRIDEKSEIIIFEKGKYISYANCGLPYYIGDIIKDRERLFVTNAEKFSRQFNIDVRTEQEVMSINTEGKSITIRKSNGEEYNESYDRLLLSPGATPMRPPMPGIDSDGIFTLRDVKDTDQIKGYINNHSVKHAVIVGAGFIGLEMAENLHNLGIEVSIVELGNQVMAPIDFSMAQHVHEHLVSKGVKLHLSSGVQSFKKLDNNLEISLSDSTTINTDLVILSIGVRPNTKLAKDANLQIGETGGIWVNEYLQTSADDIYAVGDAIEYPHPITKKPWLNYLANPANRQARIVADNMVNGNIEKYEGAIGTSIAKVFDLTVASTGLPAKKLKQLGIEYTSSYTQSNSHAGYYPDALPLYIKLTFSPSDGRLYGAQCIGYQGVDKRIDQISLIIKNNGSIYDLIRLEQTYAPPFSSAKDPIAIAGYVASNILTNAMPVVYWRDMENAPSENILLVDVRTKDEFSYGSLDNAINIPLEDIRDRINELPKDKKIYFFCAVGLRGYLAQQILFGNGYSKKLVFNLSGGYKVYKTATYNIPQTHIINLDTNTENKTEIVMAHNIIKIDACGLSCPGPIMKVKQEIDKINLGDRLEIESTDAGFARDSESWCQSTGNKFISSSNSNGKYNVIIEKGAPIKSCAVEHKDCAKGKTLIMFSDDLDKALATFVLANGAAATGAKTTIFFTFWGLNVIKKAHKPKVNKDIFGKMFSMMLPKDSTRLSLSKMSMFGIGDKMMRYIMRSKNIESLESLRQQAIEQGVEFIACQMSMDVMGVNKEELLDNVTIGGVATYMERADNANVNLFV